MAEIELRQRDLSHLSVERMNALERAEMKRRYEAFVAALRSVSPRTDAPEPGKKTPHRWAPPRVR